MYYCFIRNIERNAFDRNLQKDVHIRILANFVFQIYII